jgi:hypothetical protein
MDQQDVDKVIDGVADMLKVGLRYALREARSAEQAVERTWRPGADAGSGGSSANGAPQTNTPQTLDFHLGEWRRFHEGGEAYQVVAPVRKSGEDWLMRIRLKDGGEAEYLLSQIERNPPLTGGDL